MRFGIFLTKNSRVHNNDEEGMQHNLHKSYVMQIMYKNMNEYDYNEEMPVDTRSEKIMRARLAF